MKHLATLPSLTLWGIVLLASSAAGQRSEANFLRVVRPYAGPPLLVVEYPWQLHPKVSIEVQWISQGQPLPADPRPLTFRERLWKGDVESDAYRCLDAAERVKSSAKRHVQGIDISLSAQRNSFNQPALTVQCQFTTPDGLANSRTAYCLLDRWALNGRTLQFDLPEEHYGLPGTLRVWLLRGKDTVWLQTVAWPGIPGAPAPQVAGVKEPAKPASAKPAATKPAGEKPAAKSPPAKKESKPKPPADDPFA